MWSPGEMGGRSMPIDPSQSETHGEVEVQRRRYLSQSSGAYRRAMSCSEPQQPY